MIDQFSIGDFFIDKNYWTKVKFGDVAFEPKESAKDAVAEGIEHVVGLEHIDSEDIHLRRSASIEKSTTFTKIFAKEDVLFGRRRAYLKKAAQAKFEGICSGDITVMRAKEILIPALLPFIVNNEKFFDYAITHSAGGLSPRVKFKDLANYEFLLPPKDQQIELAELLWSCDSVVESDLSEKTHLSKTLDVEIESKIHGVDLTGNTIKQVIKKLSKKMNIITLKNMGEILKGKGIAKSEVIKNGIPCVRYGELYTKHDRIIREFYSFVSPDSAKKAINLKTNDILFAGSGETITEIGKSAAFVGQEEVYAGSDILVFRPKNMDGTYLGYLMNSQLVRQQLNKFGTGATVMHVYGSDIEKIEVPERSLEEQVEIGFFLESISRNIFLIEDKLLKAKLFQKSLINQVF